MMQAVEACARGVSNLFAYLSRVDLIYPRLFYELLARKCSLRRRNPPSHRTSFSPPAQHRLLHREPQKRALSWWDAVPRRWVSAVCLMFSFFHVSYIKSRWHMFKFRGKHNHEAGWTCGSDCIASIWGDWGVPDHSSSTPYRRAVIWIPVYQASRDK